MLVLNLDKGESIEFQDAETGKKIGDITIADKSNLEYIRLAFDFPKSVTIIRSNAIERIK